MTDGELVRRIRSGEGEALTVLMNRWAPRALALCHVHSNRDAAADLAQESLLRAISNLSQLKSAELFGSWLRGIVKRVCMDWISSKSRSMVPFSSIHRDGFDVNQIAERNRNEGVEESVSEELREALSTLPIECREVLHLYYSSKMTYQELGDILGVSAATINARLTRGRALLREQLMPRVETRS